MSNRKHGNLIRRGLWRNRLWSFGLGFCVLLALTLSGCGGSAGAGTEGMGTAKSTDEEESISFYAMNTYMSVSAYGADAELLQQAESLVLDMEGEVSATSEGSAVYRLNHSGSASLSQEAAYLLDRALSLCAETDGALDISLYPIVRAWGFTTEDENYRVPEPEEIEQLLEKVDYSRVSVNGTEVSLPEGMEIDLGSVTKGYIGDRICALLRDAGIEHALLNLGGNIQTLGVKPDGSLWRVAVQSPEGDGIVGVLSTSDKAVITSGGYERYFEDENGNIWWHIMDSENGYPAKNGLISVTIIGDEGLYCDALSTALFVMGQDGAIGFWQSHRDFEMVLINDRGELLLTPGLADSFTPTGDYSYTISLIETTN